MDATHSDVRFWDRAARKYASDPIADMAGYERTLQEAARHLTPEARVFEWGCGTGTTALRLAPLVAHLTATDISAEMIAIAREKAAEGGPANLRFEVATPRTASWPEASFDAALAFNVLHLVADRAEALAGVRRWLKPDGVFISKTPCLKEMNPLIRAALPLMQALGKAPTVAVFDAAQLEAEITAAGFNILERARHGSNRKDPRLYLVAQKR